jgi:TolA-binding protein
MGARQQLLTAQLTDPGFQTIVQEFPAYDLGLWLTERADLASQRATRSLSRAPDAAETLSALLDAGRIDDVLEGLRRVARTRPMVLADALEAMGGRLLLPPPRDARDRTPVVRDIITEARSRLPGLPREDAARLARQLITLEASLGSDNPTRRTQLAAFVHEYQGTTAALLAEIDLIQTDPPSQARLDRLAAFAAAHPRSEAAAKAVYVRGMDLAVNALALRIEPRKSDPTPRFLDVIDVVRELESGKYPPSRWVRDAPDLVDSFAAFDPVYGDGSLDRMVDATVGFLKSHAVGSDGQPALPLIANTVTRRIADLYARKGQPIVGVERVLSELEAGTAAHDAAKFVRAVFYISARQQQPPADRSELTRKAMNTLTTLHDEADGLYERKALASLASLQFAERSFADARDSYASYVSSYPESPWAWVAALRVAQCEETLGDWAAADEAYRQVVARFGATPAAVVLGQEYGARASEALGNFDEALLEHQRALDALSGGHASRYALPGPPPPPSPTGVPAPRTRTADITPDGLAERITQMARSLDAPGGSDLERARWLITAGHPNQARAVLQHLLDTSPRSPLAPDARFLAHRVDLDEALAAFDADDPRGDAAAATSRIDALTREPFDAAVAVARIARAVLSWKSGADRDAERELRAALEEWHAHQPKPDARLSDVERDVAEIRSVVFRPGGGGVFEGVAWNAFEWPGTPPAFSIVDPAVRVVSADGRPTLITLYTPLASAPGALFVTANQMAMLDMLMNRLGGRKTRTPGAIMETPNQPIGASADISRLFNRFFPMRPGHWEGWVFGTYPIITEVQFLDAARTRAAAHVTVGYSGAAVLLEKANGVWKTTGLTGKWIT